MTLVTSFVVMGVSGCGKSSVGAALARGLGVGFVDGDDLHPAANLRKMSHGTPLTDDDRAPWLRRVGQTLGTAPDGCVIACSALKREYRDVIRAAAGRPVCFIYLRGSRAVIAQRIARRTDHFMPATLLDSQFTTLEPPEPDETALTVDIKQPLGPLVDHILSRVTLPFDPNTL